MTSSLELFQPDDLSRPAPSPEPLDQARRRAALAALARYLPDAGGARLGRLPAGNPLGLNVVADLPRGRFLLKGRTEAWDRERLRREARLADALARAGAPVAPLAGDLLEEEAATWLLYGYVEGAPFRGTEKELDSAAEAFHALSAAASRIDPALFEAEPGDGFLDDIEPLLEEPVLADSPDPKLAELTRGQAGLLKAVLARVREERRPEGRVLPLHLDYHPMNLLMRGGAVACVLDVEDVAYYPAAAGIGFAGYKLIRQALVDPATRATERPGALARRWLAPWRGSLSLDELAWGARYRVLALIHAILDACLRREDTRHNYDFPKKLTHLLEIGEVFGEGAQ